MNTKDIDLNDSKQVEKFVSENFKNFWYNRIYSFQNVCIQSENDRLDRLHKHNLKIENKTKDNEYNYDFYYDYETTSEEEEYEIEYSFTEYSDSE